ncbi:MAG: hypothetical protein LH615_08440 [Ferruginibacter sp.]|nr:hypothetical protein [Ferruginibacter sp.]
MLILTINILAFSQIGYYAIMRYMQEEHKEFIKAQIHDKLKDDEMQIISLNDNEGKIYWQEEGKEFLLNGELYDVVKIKTDTGKTIIYCVNDSREKDLVNAYHSNTKNNSSKDKKAKTNVETAPTLFVVENKKSTVIPLYKFIREYYLFTSPLSCGKINLPFQPPKC